MDKCGIRNHPKVRYSDTEGVPAFFLFCSFLFNWSVPARRGGGPLPLLSRFLRWRKKGSVCLSSFSLLPAICSVSPAYVSGAVFIFFVLSFFRLSFFLFSLLRKKGPALLPFPTSESLAPALFPLRGFPLVSAFGIFFCFSFSLLSPPCGKSLSRGGQKTGVPERGGKKENGQERQEKGGRTTWKKDTKRMRGAS